MKKVTWFIFMLLVSFNNKAQQIDLYVLSQHEHFIEYSQAYSAGWSIFTHAAKKANIQINIIQSPWIRTLEFLKEGKIDSAFISFSSKTRRENIKYSLPISLGGISIYELTSKNSNIAKLINLQESTVGVLKGSIHAELAKEMGFKSSYESIERKELHKLLLGGRIDYILETKSIVEYFCRNKPLLNDYICLKEVGSTISKQPLFVLYSNKKPVDNKIKQINKAIIGMYKSGEVKSIFTKVGYSQEDYFIWEEIFNQSINIQD